MTEFLSPDSIKHLVPVLINDEQINNVNVLLSEMVKNNKQNTVVMVLCQNETLTLNEINRELCKIGWRVYGKELNGYMNIMVDNPFYKSNDSHVNEVISFKKEIK